MDWREGLSGLIAQFDAAATQSSGLHHLMVEVPDNERDRASGPDWFVATNPELGGASGNLLQPAPWRIFASFNLPGVPPAFREIPQGSLKEEYVGKRVITDATGTPRAVFEPPRYRFGYMCGGSSRFDAFKSLAQMASRILTDVKELRELKFAEDVVDLFRTPSGLHRYVFGTVNTVPKISLARGWSAGIYQEENGVVIDVPVSGSTPDESHWILLLHRLAWRRISGCPLHGERRAWNGTTTVPFEWVDRGEMLLDFSNPWVERFAQFTSRAFYSTLGDENAPLDVNLASSFAIRMLLSKESRTAVHTIAPTKDVDYSNEPWNTKPLPKTLSSPPESLKEQPSLLLLTATAVERDAVLKALTPLDKSDCLAKVFHGNNTYFLGRFGAYVAALCMSEMGSIGRDASYAVASDSLRLWKPAATIVVGIAFGRDREKQKIGDVLVADRIISYEPERLGSDSAISRGQHFQSSAALLNRFRNVTDWQFVNPRGVPCDIHFGPVLSGEKLVDDPDFKNGLFDKFGHAIGGEMEGAGVASCAERQKRDWIIVKGICDWADGEKTNHHQGFAAAAAVDLARTVFADPGVLPNS